MVSILDNRRLISRVVVLLAIAAISVVAACASDDPDPTATATNQPPATNVSPTNTPEPTETSDPTATPTNTSPTSTSEPNAELDVQVRSVAPYGDILVDGDGMTLYIFDNDMPGVSNCSGGCLSAWPPLAVDDEPEVGSGVTADIGTITRTDGSTQVTVNDYPAYYWQGDSAPGDTLGHGVNNVWWVFSSDGTPQRPINVNVAEDEEYGSILTDGTGMTLYIFDRDAEGVSNCSGNCLGNWPPVLADFGASAGTGVTAEISTIARDDGSNQVTVNGFPAYYWMGDSAAGDTAGHGVGGVWWVFNSDGSPQRPAKVALHEDAERGNILVDGNGMTLYIFDNDTEGVSNCSGGCLNAWPPLLTDYEPVGLNGVEATIGTITRSDGSMQVTVNGFPAYFWQGDSETGDTTGHGVNNVWWVFNPDGSPQRPAKVGLFDQQLYDNILVGEGDLSLYVFENDTVGVSNCTGGCAVSWPPFLTEHPPVALAGVEAELGVIERADGSMQVTVNGLPVYYWQGDSAPGDISGHGRNQLWWVIDPNGVPFRAP